MSYIRLESSAATRPKQDDIARAQTGLDFGSCLATAKQFRFAISEREKVV
jgi:hypothetical protein